MNKLLFLGNERLGTGLGTDTPVLKSLIASGYEISAVVVAQSQVGSSRNARELEIVRVANQHKIPVFSPDKLDEIKDQIVAMNVEAAVLVAYGKIVSQNVIDLFPKGIINIHPSLLPKHRGPTPIESVILNGDTQTGVSLMQLAAKMDAGPVYVQETIELKGFETKQELATKLQQLGSDMLIKHLPAILNGSIKPEDQNNDEATYDKLIVKADGLLDFNKSASRLEREVRAFAGWPKSRTTIGETEVIITKARVVPSESNQASPGTVISDGSKMLRIVCAEDSLEIDHLQPNNKKEMPIQAFLSGYSHLI